MAEATESMETLLTRASRLEHAYDWSGAAETYLRAASTTSADNALQTGNLLESAAYALYRRAFQAAGREELVRLVAEAVAQYERAMEAYERLGGEKALPWRRRCKAMATYLGIWSTEDPAEKRRLASESWGEAKGAMDAFEQSGDLRQLRRTNNLLTFVVSIGYLYSWDPKYRESIVREALEYSIKATDAHCEECDKGEAARALINASYYTMVTCSDFIEVGNKAEWDARSGEFMRKGLELCREESLDALSFTYKFGTFPSTLTEDETAGLRDEVLEHAKETKDLLRIAIAAEWMANLGYMEANEALDADSRDSSAEEALRWAKEAGRCYSIASSTHLSECMFWSSSPLTGFYALKASLEADLERKRDFATKGLEAVREGLELARRLDIPEAIIGLDEDAAQILFSLAKTERDPVKKRKALEEGLGHGRRFLETWTSLHGYDFGIVIGKADVAEIGHELSEMETDPEKKIRLCRDAISLITEAYDDLVKQQELASASVRRWSRLKMGAYRHRAADWHLRIHDASGEKSDLKRAAEGFQHAAELFRDADQPSRTGESYWKAAQALDYLGDHLGSSEKFADAARAYALATERLPGLSKMYNEHSLYMQAWSQIELARHHHGRQEMKAAGERYTEAAVLHEATDRWRALAPNYRALAELEEAESLSRKDMSREAVASFGKASRLLVQSQASLAKYLGETRDAEERDHVTKLSKAAGLRREYCDGRLALEEARVLDKAGDELGSFDKYGRAADTFEKLQTEMESDVERRGIQLMMTLSRAWQSMAKAEAEASPDLYDRASEMFEKAKDLSVGEKAKLTALGHSRFCRALAEGTRFADTGDDSLHAAAARSLESAAKHYLRAGLDSDSEYAKASRRLFDAYVYMNRASREDDPARKAKLCAMTEKVLEASAAAYSKAGYPKKREQALKLLKEVKDERELAASLTDILHAPDVVAKTPNMPSPSPTEEEAVGVQRFEHADVQATLFAKPKVLNVGQDLKVEIELVNAGKGAAQLTRVEGAIPEGFDIMAEPDKCRVEGDCLIMRGRRLDALKTDDVTVMLKPTRRGSFRLAPRVMYLDDVGRYRSHELEPVDINVKELGISGWLRGPGGSG